MNCVNCNAELEGGDRFCSVCGGRVDNGDEEMELIEQYFHRGFEYQTILSFLQKYHGISMSLSTLKSRLKQQGLKRVNPNYDIQVVRETIRKELDGPGCSGGYRAMWHALRLEGIQVPRRIVAQLLKELDPEGCQLRRARRLRRRSYHSPGPNHVWHVDGYDKLKPYGLPIHGCIDGWSRKIMWLQVSRTNNSPHVPATLFLDCVRNFGGCPIKLRTDCGTENGVMAAMQCYMRDSVDAHKYGTSPANQRIEAWWSYLRKNRTNWWMNFFKDLVDREVFTPGNILHAECLWFCFAGILQNDLDKVKHHWNSHYIRASRYDTIKGRPDELYFLPERHGGVDNLIQAISSEQLEYLSENLIFNEVENDYQEYFDYLILNSELQMPVDWRDALDLYNAIIHIAQHGN